MSDTTAALRGSPQTDAVAGPSPVVPRPRADLELDGDSLTWRELVAIMEADEVTIRLAPAARDRMGRTRAGALAALADGQRVYGWNQGLGPLKDRAWLRRSNASSSGGSCSHTPQGWGCGHPTRWPGWQ